MMPVPHGPIQQVIGYSDELRGKGEPDLADEVLVEVAVARPLDAPELLATLRRTLRASRADRVTARLSRVPIEQRAVVARALLDAHSEPDATALLESICGGSDEEVLGALAIFEVSGPKSAWRPGDAIPGADTVEALLGRLLAASSERFEGLMEQLYDAGQTGPARRAATLLASASPIRAMKLAADFARKGQRLGCQDLVRHFALRARPRAIAALLNGLEDSVCREIDPYFSEALMHRPDPHAVFDALRRDCADEVADRFLVAVAEGGPAATLIALYEGLLAMDARSAADRVVVRAGTRVDCGELCDELHRSARHRLAYLIAEARI